MSKKRILLATVPVAALLIGYGVSAKTRCAPLRDTDKAKLVAYVQKRYKVPADAQLQVEEASLVSSTCYRKLEFKTKSSPRPFHISLFATPDLRFLARELMDSRTEPVVASRGSQRVLAGLADGDFPSLGPANAPVTLAVFSDFQCPFCARFAETMRKEILPAEKEHVRVVFHYFPLSMHAWARPAAEAAACAFQQKNEFFWSFHDFFFEHQRELTSDNLQQKLLDHAHGISGFDAAKFQSCLARPETKAAMDREVAFAEQSGIQATPTMFLNGREIAAGAPDQLRALISGAAKNPQAFAETADSSPTPARRQEARTIPGLGSGNLPALGPANAPVTLAVFSDFQCPYCARFARTLRNDVLPADAQRVRIVFRHFPLPMHT